MRRTPTNCLPGEVVTVDDDYCKLVPEDLVAARGGAFSFLLLKLIRADALSSEVHLLKRKNKGMGKI